jgi:NADP-dependent aldehyde dehydrogenase
MPVPEPILVNGRWRPARAVATFAAFDPATATAREAVWPVSTWADCDEALDAAVAAAAELARLPADRIARPAARSSWRRPMRSRGWP